MKRMVYSVTVPNGGPLSPKILEISLEIGSKAP